MRCCFFSVSHYKPLLGNCNVWSVLKARDEMEKKTNNALAQRTTAPNAAASIGFPFPCWINAKYCSKQSVGFVCVYLPLCAFVTRHRNYINPNENNSSMRSRAPVIDAVAATTDVPLMMMICTLSTLRTQLHVAQAPVECKSVRAIDETHGRGDGVRVRNALYFDVCSISRLLDYVD